MLVQRRSCASLNVRIATSAPAGLRGRFKKLLEVDQVSRFGEIMTTLCLTLNMTGEELTEEARSARRRCASDAREPSPSALVPGVCADHERAHAQTATEGPRHPHSRRRGLSALPGAQAKESPATPFLAGLSCFLTIRRDEDGGGVPMLEPIRSLHYSRVDKIVRDLRRIYQENSTLFDIPAFARKVY